jgi:hypothetical protein
MTTRTKTRAAAPADGLPPSARKLAETLLDQQCWCWGCDVRCQEGNLLRRCGFERTLSPEPKRYHSVYSLRMPDAAIRLWGFGFMWVDWAWGGVFLKRFGFAPRWVAPEQVDFDAYRPDQIITTAICGDGIARLRQQTAEALRWIAGYERWVALEMGAGYRAECVESCPGIARSRRIAAEAMADTWDTLANAYQTEA